MRVLAHIRRLPRRALQSGGESVIVSGSLIAASLILERTGTSVVAAEVLMTAAAVVAGIPVAVKGIRALLTRHVGIEVLVTIAAVGALIIGETWEAAAVTFLFNLGGLLESMTMARTRRVIGELINLAPVRARVLRDAVEVEVDIADIATEETVVVRPGERIPVDGEVLQGTSRVDESSITGESYPPSKSVRDQVFAGTFNQSGMLQIRTLRVGADTTLAGIIHRVEEAQEDKAPTERLMDLFSRWYTPSIIVLSIVVLAISRDIEFALTVLVIACPGALVISTPVSIVAGIGGAAREGILLKGGAHLERSGKVSAVAFDKTGTLTMGKPTVTSVTPVADDDPLYWAAIAERGSEHPLGKAILAQAHLDDGTPYPDSTETFTGRGIIATLPGETILVGNRAFMAEQDIETGPAEASTAPSDSHTVVYVARGNGCIGTISISDPVRPGAATAIQQLRSQGIDRIIMLTGDNRETAETIGREVGITETHAGLLPEEKLNHIRQLNTDGFITAMVGDGINDTPALAAADVGIALGATGSDVALETADIALMRNDLRLVSRSISLARRALNNIRQNVAIALITVFALLAGVLFGKIHMAGGMLIHELSVMTVILNGMRLLRKKGRNPGPL